MTANLFFDNSRELWWKRMILDTHWCAPITFTWLEFTSLEIQYIDNLLFILGRKKSRNCGKSFNYFHLLIQQPLFDVILMNVCKVLRSEIVLNILFFFSHYFDSSLSMFIVFISKRKNTQEIHISEYMQGNCQRVCSKYEFRNKHEIGLINQPNLIKMPLVRPEQCTRCDMLGAL